ncbi:MAG: thiamine phosphate synthase [Kofleriaceae bacterium]|nr:thiamine phosphate synthase [Kofleriaceae bacterium]
MEVAAAIRGFYAVLDRDDAQLARMLLGAGASVIQLRIKPEVPVGAGALVNMGRALRVLCNEAGAALVVNDRIDVALAIGADGVHLGQTDLALASARQIAGSRLWIGISTHNLPQVEAAVAGGADYLGFGPVFETRTKKNPDPVQGLGGLQDAVRAAKGTPVVAIGGITASQVPAVYAAGASAICAISAVNDAQDVVAAARLFQPGR